MEGETAQQDASQFSQLVTQMIAELEELLEVLKTR